MTAQEFLERFHNGTLGIEKPHCVRCGRPINSHPDNTTTVPLENVTIQIIKTPRGEAPEELRKQWPGVRIPAVSFKANNTNARGVLSGKPLPPSDQYVVFQSDTIAALEKGNPTAAEEWRKLGFPKGDSGFTFQVDEVIEVPTVLNRA